MSAALEEYFAYVEKLAARPARTFPRGAVPPGLIDRSRDGNGVTALIEGFDIERAVDAWVLSDRVIPTLRGGQERLCRVEHDAVREWIARVDPRDVLCVADHEGAEGSLGTWFAFRLIGNLLQGRLLIDRGELGDMLLHVLDNDPSWGFSFSARSADFRTERDDHGQPVDVIERLDLEEVGPTPSPADSSAFVIRIAGREPRWQRKLEGLERHEQLSRLLARRPELAPR